MREPKVFLINPAHTTVGMSFITPRWLFVIAAATPNGSLGLPDPILIDESIMKFDPSRVNEGDVVGVGISTDNCLAGYRALRKAKERGATVIVGGIHATIFPEEPIRMGADAVVTGNGDIVWGNAVRDALDGHLRQRYDGGKERGDMLLPARWDLLLKQNLRNRYLFPTVQTVVGCPENCKFCSVWVTEGRNPRLRTTDAIIQEMNLLDEMGFSTVMFADDNFNPATLLRIAREDSPAKRKELEGIRERRMAFFREYASRVNRVIPTFTQMTSEVVGDEEYLAAMHEKMGVHGALVGIESFTAEGLEKTRKTWNPVGERMVNVIRTIQSHGIYVLGSIITGLETDTLGTLAAAREFAKSSGMLFAQFPIYHPFPGTVDFREMVTDLENRIGGSPLALVPKHATKLLYKEYWLKPNLPRVIIEHPHISAEDLLLANQECWSDFYSFREIWKRAVELPCSLTWKLIFAFASRGFRAIYAGRGISADGARRKLGFLPRLTLTGAGKLLAFSSYRRSRRSRRKRKLAA
jgi:radical SAM superfamily enzyme YgiQ (UPF0313 family)